MLTEEQIVEIREHLERAQNPLFFFDNDNDGLAGFLLFQRFLGRGKGVAIKSFPDLNESYYRRIRELNPDYIFILDKPAVSQKFIDKVKQDNLPIVWIDHHIVEKPEDESVNYYNPYYIDGNCEPISYLAYKITENKKDIWLSMIGCISDCYMPDFYPEFKQKFPKLDKKDAKEAFDLLYDSEIGLISRILDFSLKDTTTNVVNMLRFMMRTNSPEDILEENHKTKQILKRYNQIDSKYQGLMERARKCVEDNLIYFQYGGELSLSANLANQLIYEFPDKIIVVVYISADIANISIRSKEKDIREITLKTIEGIDGATGGGHMCATGAKMFVSDLPEFRERIKKLIEV